MVDSPLKRLVNLRHESRWLESAVDEWLGRPKLSREDKGWFHPSSLGHTCDAYLAFAFLGIEGREQISSQLQRIFDNGSARDNDIKNYLQDSGLSIVKVPEQRHIEIPLYRIRGDFDEAVANPRDGSPSIVEIKTMREDLWKNLEGPNSDHVIQVHPYMFATNIFRTIFVYENKNDQSWKTFLQMFDGQLWNGLLGRLEGILLGLRSGYVHRTPQPYNETKCPFYYMCATANIPKLVEESGLVI